MSTRIARIKSTPGQSLYAFPEEASLADWLTKRIALVERDSPDSGMYEAELDAGTNWSAFAGDSQPTGWGVWVGDLEFPPESVTPFLDTIPPEDWIVEISDRTVSGVGQRRIEVRPGEVYTAAWDCSSIMSPKRTNLFGFDLPTCESEAITITPTSDPSDPRHGLNGRFAIFNFSVAEGLDPLVASSFRIEGKVRPTQWTLARPFLDLVVTTA